MLYKLCLGGLDSLSQKQYFQNSILPKNKISIISPLGLELWVIINEGRYEHQYVQHDTNKS